MRVQMAEKDLQAHRSKHPLRHLYKPPPPQDYSKNFMKLILVIIISFIFIAAEMVGGIISNSISVISDAFHLVTDLLGFILAYTFIQYSRKAPNDSISFGYHRMEVMGALGNLFIIWALALFLYYEAISRLINKEFVRNPLVMLIVAVGGLIINIIMYGILHTGGHSHGLMAEECEDLHSHDAEGHHDQEHQIYKQLEQEQPPCCLNVICWNQECFRFWGYQGSKKTNQTSTKNYDRGHSHNHGPGGHDHGDHSHGGGHNHGGGGHNHSGHNHGGHSHNQPAGGGQSISMKAAVLHALTDVVQSIGLLIASILIYFFGSNRGAEVSQWNPWHLLDPISTILFSTIVIASTWPITKNCYSLIMEATPVHIDLEKFSRIFSRVEDVVDVHDLHVWDLRPGKTILIAHVFAKNGRESEVLKRLTVIARENRIYHSTFQVQHQDLKDHHTYIQCEHDIH